MSFLDEARVTLRVDEQPAVKTFIDPEQVTEDVKIDPNNLESTMLGIAAIYSRYAHYVSMARIQRDGFKSRKRLLQAKVEKAIRDKASEEGEKLTNPQVASQVDSHPVVVKADLALNEAAAVLSAIQEALNAVSMKRDMLVQLNKNRNREWEMTSAKVAKQDLSDVGL